MEFLNFRTQKEIQDAGYVVQNGTLKNLDIELNLHFGNCVSLTGIVETENGGVAAPFGLRNTTKDIGFILQAIFDLLDLSREEGRKLSSIKFFIIIHILLFGLHKIKFLIIAFICGIPVASYFLLYMFSTEIQYMSITEKTYLLSEKNFRKELQFLLDKTER